MFHLELFELSKIENLRLIHLCICLFGAVFLIMIWYNAKKENKKLEQDWGLVLISFALILWAAMDAYRFLGIMVAGQVSLVIKTFSAYNNAFFIASLPFFKHGFEKTKRKLPIFGNRLSWVITVLLTNVIIVLFYSLSWGQASEHSDIVKGVDVIYSILTFALLGYAIIKSFQKREHYRNSFMIAGLIITAMLIIPQLAFLPIFTIEHFDLISVILLVSQFALILLLLVLAQSWVVEETVEKYKMEKVFLDNELLKAANTISEIQNLLEIKSKEISGLNERLTVIQSELADNSLTNKKQNTIKDLSEREIAVLKLIDKSYQEIGDELFIARETVISHKKNIESKLGISGKENLIELARKLGLMEES